MTNLIIPQTVLTSVREKSLPIYNRLRALAADPTRNVVIFSNEFHRYVQLQFLLMMLNYTSFDVLYVVAIRILIETREKR